MELCQNLGLTGRVIVAHEGINATLEGTTENINKYLESYLADPRFSDTHIKKSVGTGSAFPKLSIKARKEIVSLHLEDVGEEDFSPLEVTGKRLKPEELKQWFETKEVGKDFHIIDMRNDYEHAVGYFKGSVLPKLSNFRDIPEKINEMRQKVNADNGEEKEVPVLTVCTGGVRCEKASGYLVKKGFKEVYQLDGGIVSYMEKFPNQDFLGALYVFDKRIVMDYDRPDRDEAGIPEKVIVGKCAICSTPTEHYINCTDPSCNKHFLCCESCLNGKERILCTEHGTEHGTEHNMERELELAQN
jgi:UPF0176 protein